MAGDEVVGGRVDRPHWCGGVAVHNKCPEIGGCIYVTPCEPVAIDAKITKWTITKL